MEHQCSARVMPHSHQGLLLNGADGRKEPATVAPKLGVTWNRIVLSGIHAGLVHSFQIRSTNPAGQQLFRNIVLMCKITSSQVTLVQISLALHKR